MVTRLNGHRPQAWIILEFDDVKDEDIDETYVINNKAKTRLLLYSCKFHIRSRKMKALSSINY